MKNRYKVATRIPLKFIQEVNLGVVRNGYSMKEKYKWVSDAIEEMVDFKGYIEHLVEPVLTTSKESKAEVFSITEDANQVLLRVEGEVKSKFGINRGAKGAVLRAALLHKLVRES